MDAAAALPAHCLRSGSRIAGRGHVYRLRRNREAETRVGPACHQGFRFDPSAVMRPGVLTGTLHNDPPAVTNNVFKSAPPNAQLVTSSVGIGTNSSSLPAGERM